MVVSLAFAGANPSEGDERDYNNSGADSEFCFGVQRDSQMRLQTEFYHIGGGELEGRAFSTQRRRERRERHCKNYWDSDAAIALVRVARTLAMAGASLGGGISIPCPLATSLSEKPDLIRRSASPGAAGASRAICLGL